MFAEKGLVKDVSGSCLFEMYTGYKIAEYKRNCWLFDWELQTRWFQLLFFGFTHEYLSNLSKDRLKCVTTFRHLV